MCGPTPPLSWRHIEDSAKINGGSVSNVLFPYEETSPGSRQFDLTRFNAAWWTRFRQQLEYLQSKGIIVHLLLWNGWQLRDNSIDWPGHFFNPANNVNPFTDSLGGALSNRLTIYHSVANGNTQLVEAQRAWYRKMIETTHDLDNVYFDLIHELYEHYTDWNKTRPWIEDMANTVRIRWQQLEPTRPIILGMDTGGLDAATRDWIFTRPYFDLLIYGKEHTVSNAVNWRKQYKKPYIPQETWDENTVKYSYRSPDQRIHLRKYLWKFTMAKAQQLDIYTFYVGFGQNLPGYEHNYNPNGWNPFENDAPFLRQFWNKVADYPNLWFNGTVNSGPGSVKMVLSSNQEALVYLSSPVGQQNVNYNAQSAQLSGLALSNGSYTAEIVKPDKGVLSTQAVAVSNGQASLNLPAFTDDLAVRLATGQPGPTTVPPTALPPTLVLTAAPPTTVATTIPPTTLPTSNPPTITPTTSAPAGAVVTIIAPQADGTVITNVEQTRFQATAYNPGIGTNNGAGIKAVAFEIYSPTNGLLQSASDTTAAYCFFGGNGPCNAGGNTAQAPAGTYTLRARAQTMDNNWSNWVTRTFVIGAPSAPTTTPPPPTVTTAPPVTTVPPTIPPATLPPTATPVVTGTTLQVNPVPASATVGQQVTVSLQLGNAVNLYGLAVQCTVNPQVLSGVTKVDGEGFNAANSFFVNKNYNAATGSWLVAASRLRPNPAISGSVTAFSLTYNVQSAGSSPITCVAQGSDLNGSKVPITVFNGQINGNGSLPTPTQPPTWTPEPPTPTTPATATLPATPTLAPTTAGLGTIKG
ncbi:MAG TPA: cohesin domain-containing protein, partial [Phototrophicaceae bacterium]|nr:cohesin domain-containing protein [Phototrophicaceae bacterium]